MLTEREALTLSLKIWETFPTSFAEEEAAARSLGTFIDDCPACEYAMQKSKAGGKKRCGMCPIIWSGKKCFDDSSAFGEWRIQCRKQNRLEAKYYAGKIVADIRRSLAHLETKEELSQ